MEGLLYILARTVLSILQTLPLRLVARLGRFGGRVAYAFDGRHRRVALRNLQLCFGSEKAPAEIKALARENFRRIGENFACAARTAVMSFDELRKHVEFVGADELIHPPPGVATQSIVGAIGHFGNFELYARLGQFAPAFKCATTYRGLRQASLNRLLLSLRTQSGCEFFERRFEAQPLRAFMNQPAIMLGLLSDQHAGTHGLRLPFFGQECSTSAAPAIFALRYNCALYVGVCYRLELARWRIEAGPRIPTHDENGQPRLITSIMLDVNQVFETAVRRDPANWFWVHNRWKKYEPARSRAKATEPESLPA